MADFAVQSIDHVVLTVKSIEDTVDFYTTKLGMKHEVFTSNSVER
jgi:catechol 2,3-dioxygenase-like lactoylglutathione lyase family enzyme